MCPESYKDIFCNFVVRLEQNDDEIFERPLKQTQYSPACTHSRINEENKLKSKVKSNFSYPPSNQFQNILFRQNPASNQEAECHLQSIIPTRRQSVIFKPSIKLIF